jgi:hypothetical protein
MSYLYPSDSLKHFRHNSYIQLQNFIYLQKPLVQKFPNYGPWNLKLLVEGSSEILLSNPPGNVGLDKAPEPFHFPNPAHRTAQRINI